MVNVGAECPCPSRTETLENIHRRSQRYAFRVVAVCCASATVRNFPSPLSRRCHCRVTFPLTQAQNPAPSSTDTGSATDGRVDAFVLSGSPASMPGRRSPEGPLGNTHEPPANLGNSCGLACRINSSPLDLTPESEMVQFRCLGQRRCGEGLHQPIRNVFFSTMNISRQSTAFSRRLHGWPQSRQPITSIPPAPALNQPHIARTTTALSWAASGNSPAN